MFQTGDRVDGGNTIYNLSLYDCIICTAVVENQPEYSAYNPLLIAITVKAFKDSTEKLTLRDNVLISDFSGDYEDACNLASILESVAEETVSLSIWNHADIDDAITECLDDEYGLYDVTIEHPYKSSYE